MKLVRYATVYLEPSPAREIAEVALTVNNACVHIRPAGTQVDRTILVLKAGVELDERPSLAPDNTVLIPRRARQHAEAAIETAANILAVTDHCRRKIFSPYPFVALVSTLDEDLRWLDATKGFHGWHVSHGEAKLTVPLDTATLQSLRDRVDGVALLAEALAQEHPAGRFQYFLRLFEQAFAQPPPQLEKGLALFLEGAGLGYVHSEIKGWANVRDVTSHAGELTPGHVLFESQARPVIARMEQAAYDLLFNKLMWGDRSQTRRDFWRPAVATISERQYLKLSRAEATAVVFQTLDPFEAFRFDPVIRVLPLPNGAWSKWPAKDPCPSEDVLFVE
jgi:hypothetical protein